MIRKKICMLGAFAVGKTSLVARCVSGIFSERYLTTVGVKIDKKELVVDGRELNLVLWDLHGEDAFQKVRRSYLRGSSGLLFVADGTRGASLEKALELRAIARETIGPVPALLLVNKHDLASAWEVDDEQLRAGATDGCDVLRTSAKTGAGVEEAFQTLARRMLAEGEARHG